MEYIWGLDASLTHIGIVILDKDGKIEAQTFCPKKKGTPRLAEIWDKIEDYFEHSIYGNALMVCMEGYAFTPRFGQAFSLGELGGVIKLYLYRRNIPLLLVAPQTLKKFITGSGKGDKNMIMLKAFQKWGKEFADDHQCDAYGLAQIAKAIYNIEHGEKQIQDYFQYEQEVIKLVRKQLKEKNKDKGR